MSLLETLQRMAENKARLRVAENVLLRKLEDTGDSSAEEVSTLKLCLDAAIQAKDPKGFSEVMRICQMPIEGKPMEPEELEDWCYHNTLADAYKAGWRWWEIQARAVSQYMRLDGVFCPISVGEGKTLITLAIAAKGYTQKSLRKILLIVPTEVYIQLTQVDIAWARARIPLNVPLFLMGHKPIKIRRVIAKSNRPGCYILPYSCLSTRDASDNLEAIHPELIIADEAHKISRRTAARTKRLFNYIDEHEPHFVPLSGTITRKSVMDYHAGLRAALKHTSPLPYSVSMAVDWAAVLDSSIFVKGLTGPIRPLVDWARKHFDFEDFTMDTAGFRKAYQYRLQSAPGVVASSGENAIGTSLLVANHELKLGHPKLQELIDTVIKEFKTPNGDEIEHAIHAYKWLFELSAGFYNELIWPTPEALSQKKGYSVEDAKRALERALIHHAASQEYARLLRTWITHCARANLDTPMLIAANMAKHGPKNVGVELYTAWRQMKDLQFPDMPERVSRAVRVCPWKIHHAAEWASKMGSGIIWYYHQEIGRWLLETLTERGFDNLLYCPAGQEANAMIIDVSNRDSLILASWTAHGTGKNLQHHDQQLILQWPRPANAAEQLLGRTHRPGQGADELIVDTCISTEHEVGSLAATLNDALYIQQTTGNKQKVIYATWEPLPKIIPPEVLRERGYQNKPLTPTQQTALEERFGAYQMS